MTIPALAVERQQKLERFQGALERAQEAVDRTDDPWDHQQAQEAAVLRRAVVHRRLR